jgi:hypothetical protein
MRNCVSYGLGGAAVRYLGAVQQDKASVSKIYQMHSRRDYSCQNVNSHLPTYLADILNDSHFVGHAICAETGRTESAARK